MSKTAKTLRSARELVDAGLVPAAREAGAAMVGQRYAIAVTPHMAELIDAADPDDPIARQFIPDVRELDRDAHERDDPIGDHAKSPVKGLVHRYPDRVLLKIVGVCPVYCRFCFRREMVGPEADANLTHDEVAAALAYVARHSGIWEVIVTGGDPFLLSPRRMAETQAKIGEIEHVKIVRWHTRVPLVAPHLVTEKLAGALTAARQTVYVGLHVNHPRELTPAGREAIGLLVAHGIPVVSQTVLLSGVNDDVATLETLMRSLVEVRVKPYYLHHADLAPGTAHMRTSIARGQEIMRGLRQRLSGLALPTYVLDIPGGEGKVPVGPSYLTGDGTRVLDPMGVAHTYGDET